MTARIILLPYLLFMVGAAFWILAAFLPGILSNGGKPEGWFGRGVFILWIFVYPCLFVYLAEGWLRADPTPEWREKIKGVDTAIVFGFGFEKDARGHLRAGRSNEFLLQWALEHTNAGTLLVQEGVRTAAVNSNVAEHNASGKKLVRIHRRIESIDMNTFQTAYCALEKMEALGKREAVLVAHDLQLQRAGWIFEKLKLSHADWADFRFIVPEIPPVPFPSDSAQLRTRSKLIYIFCELFGSRLRDFISPAPDACLASL